MPKTKNKENTVPGVERDLAQFDEWWRQVAPSLLQSARRYLRGTDEVEDVVQEVAILALRHRSTADWKDIDSFSKWAHARLHWLIMDTWRNIKRRSIEVSLDEENHLTSQNTVNDIFGSIESQNLLIWLNDRLTNRERQVLEKRISGYSTHEIASDLGVTEATVRSLLRFARRRIAHAMALAGGDQHD